MGIQRAFLNFGMEPVFKDYLFCSAVGIEFPDHKKCRFLPSGCYRTLHNISLIMGS